MASIDPTYPRARTRQPERDPADEGRVRSARLSARLDRLDRLAANMDSRYSLFGIRFGWDSLLGLIPGVGDVASLGPAGYILLEAHRMGAPNHVKLRMAGNTALDWVVGSVPLLGDVADVWLKANRRNVKLLRDHFGVPPATEPRSAA